MVKRVGVGTRLLVGLVSIAGLVLLCAVAGYYGISQLSRTTSFLLGPVWDTSNGAQEGRIGVQSQLLAVSEALQSGNPEQHRAELDEAERATERAVRQLLDAGLLDASQREPFQAALESYRTARGQVLEAFETFRSTNERAAGEFFEFQDFMIEVELHGDKQFEDLALQPNEPVSWVGGLRSRWGVAKSAMAGNIQLLSRFYHYQRLLAAADETEARGEFDYYLGLLEQSITDLSRYPEFKTLVVENGTHAGSNYADALESLLREHQSGFDQAIERFTRFKEAKAAYLQISREVIEQARLIVDGSSTQFLAQAERVEQVKRLAYAALAIALALSLAMAVVLGIINVRSVSNPLQLLVRSARKVLGNDLNEDAALSRLSGGRGQFSELASVFSAQTSALRDMVGNLKQGAAELVNNGGTIAATAEQTASSAAEQAATAAEVSSTVDELLQTSKTTTTSASNVLQSAENASMRGRNGLESIEEASQAMQVISDRVNEVAVKVLELGEQGARIDDILTTVNNLAEQSNLLAVNASIEAAKAGEQGRGFAVVADEVRNLAEQSKDSTRQIRVIVKDIQSATQSAVMSAEEGTKRVVDGRDAIEAASQVISELSGVLDEASDRARQIVGAATQQTSGVQEISRAMEAVAQASSENAQGARMLETAASDLNSVAKRMESLTAQYAL